MTSLEGVVKKIHLKGHVAKFSFSHELTPLAREKKFDDHSFWGSLIYFFGVMWGGADGGAFAFVDFESFLFYYFEVPKFSIFLLVILCVFKNICVKFHKGGKGVFSFLLVNF